MQNLVRRLSIGSGSPRPSVDGERTADEAAARARTQQHENELVLKEINDIQRAQIEGLQAEAEEMRADNARLKEELEEVGGWGELCVR